MFDKTPEEMTEEQAMQELEETLSKENLDKMYEQEYGQKPEDYDK